MTDRDVIWVHGQFGDKPLAENERGHWFRRNSFNGAEAYIPLARAERLQRALENIAKQELISEQEQQGDICFGYDEIIKHARKALTELERTEGKENDN